MGTHRSGTRSRGVSKGPVIAVVAVVLLLVAIFGWFQLRDRAADQDSAAAAECVQGAATLNVTVDPAVAGPVRTIADQFNATKPKIRDHCAQVTVTVQPASAVVAAYSGGGTGWPAALGPQPAMWIPDSTRSIELMRVPGLMEGAPVPLAASPIVLAVPEELRAALDRAKITWADLARLQQGSLNEVGLSGWGGLKMAMPSGDATLAAAAAAGSAISGSDPLSDEAAQSGQVIATISGLAATAPEMPDTAAALAAINATPKPTVHAVATTEQQLKAQGGLAEYRPLGAAPIADYPVALMSGPWVDKTQNLIATVFADYLRAPAQATIFTTAGFAAAPPNVAPTPSRTALAKVKETLANPVLGVQSTVLVDVSSSMSSTDGSVPRLANVLAALGSTMTVMPPNFGLGVWTFGKNLDGNKPYEVQAETAPLSDNQRTAINTALGQIKASDLKPDQAYPSLLAAYRSAVANYAAGRTNSILLITDGPEDDSTLTGSKLVTDITAATDAAHPVRIDVIVIGGNGTQTLQTLAQQTSGTYTRLATSNDVSFGTAIVQALTTP